VILRPAVTDPPSVKKAAGL